MIDHVKIGPFIYTVSDRVKNLHDHNGDLRISLWGHIKHSHQQIEIEEDISDETRLQVLWHEILHGIIHQRGGPPAETEVMEQIIDAISYGLIEAIRDNPQLIDVTVNKTKDNPFTDMFLVNGAKPVGIES